MNQGMSTHIGYDRYGRGQFALRATYSLTATPSQHGAAASTSTAEKVDTNTDCPQLPSSFAEITAQKVTCAEAP